MINFDFATIQPVSPKRIAIRVKPVAERALRDGHPWVFNQSILKQSHDGKPGDLAVIFDRKDRFLAIGLYDPDSEIRVRILQNEKPEVIDGSWFFTRLNEAARIRRPIRDTKTNAYRLVHGENDGLPGLVIDRYGEYYVVKIYTAAWVPHLQHVVNYLIKKARMQGCVLRLSNNLKERLPQELGISDGLVIAGQVSSSSVPFLENGMYFAADIIQGQKTGFFLDQRDNRSLVEGLAKGKSVLNVFAYTGGFSLYAARGGAKNVASLDLSRPALQMAEKHFALNDGFSGVRNAAHEILRGDAYQILEELDRRNRRYDLIILDPPSFARSKRSIDRAKSAYQRLNSLGIRLLQSGGILVSASCSSRVSAADFFAIVQQSARLEKRKMSVIRKTGQPIDHPIGFPEGAYLKCLFAEVF